jgi:hypothetical protein
VFRKRIKPQIYESWLLHDADHSNSVVCDSDKEKSDNQDELDASSDTYSGSEDLDSNSDTAPEGHIHRPAKGKQLKTSCQVHTPEGLRRSPRKHAEISKGKGQSMSVTRPAMLTLTHIRS